VEQFFQPLVWIIVRAFKCKKCAHGGNGVPVVILKIIGNRLRNRLSYLS
jgi:hypothetical protein